MPLDLTIGLRTLIRAKFASVVTPLANFLPTRAVKVLHQVTDWREAISRAGDGLIAQGAVDPQYTREMIAVVEENGPYIVIAPRIALAHARPSSLVKFNALSLVTLEHPVEFGAQKNDPVEIVFGLAATDSRSHLELMASLAQALSRPGFVESVRGAQNFREIQGILS